MTLARPDNELKAANGALAHLGETRLSSLDENRPAARAIKDHFGQVRDELLREHDWNFARKWETLSEDPSKPEGAFSKACPLPGDCLRVLVVVGASQDDWAVEGGATGAEDGEASAVGFLYSEFASPRIGYVALVGEPMKWDATFLAVFEFRLAAKIAPLIGRDDGTADAMRANAERILLRARRKDAREAAPSRQGRTGRFLSVRLG